ncbi:MAG: hypothetical protein BWY71_00136 [Planctomycetes bacterium ADurb.Bin412]|nr:MAG: hypothetical protein BWY71_00136 [Planctomycetes bacterium ADurb.Bin412]
MEPGKTITVSGYIKCAPYVDASSYPPRLEIIDAYNDPLVDSGNSALASDQVAVASGLNLDWQAVSVQWTNPDTIARHVFVRMMNRFYMWENFQILELEAPNYPATTDTKDGVFFGIGNIYEGSYDPVASAVWPAAANVSTVETAYGPTGSEYAGSLNLTLYVLKSAVVSESYVVVGHDNYTGGSAGTYPTTATSKAEQLAEDKAAVTAAAASIKDDTTILTVAGTYDFTTALATSYSDGQANQLAADQAAVDAEKASIKDDTEILGVTGTYDFTTALDYAYGDGVNAGKASQLATDAAAVLAVAEYITTDVTDLLGVAGTFDESARNTDPGEAHVEDGVTYKILNVDKEGTLTGTGGTPPAAPTITATAGTGSVTITIVGAAGVTNYVKYKGNHTAWQDGGSRSGDGDVTVSGLDNDIVYTFVVYSESGGLYSTPSPAVNVTLTASLDGDIFDNMDGHGDIFLDKFGQTVTYKPAGGGSRSIQGIIDLIDAEDGSAPGTRGPQITVWVNNNATDGISAAELNTGGDKLTCSYRKGVAAIDRRIIAILDQDNEMIQLEVR